MKRTAILIDDDPLVHDDVRYRLRGIPALTLVATFLGTDEAVGYIAEHGDVDVIFADIMMPGKDGYEANRLLAGACRLFVFLTQKETHGPEIFTTASMVHYLRKPISAAAVALLLEQMQTHSGEASGTEVSNDVVFLYDRNSKKRIAVKPENILMITFELKYGEVTLANEEKKMLILGSATATARQLRAWGKFIRISRDTIISTDAVSYVDRGLVVYFNWGECVAVKRTYQPLFRAFMKRYRIGR